jgi:hypothetical protein
VAHNWRKTTCDCCPATTPEAPEWNWVYTFRGNVFCPRCATEWEEINAARFAGQVMATVEDCDEIVDRMRRMCYPNRLGDDYCALSPFLDERKV